MSGKPGERPSAAAAPQPQRELDALQGPTGTPPAPEQAMVLHSAAMDTARVVMKRQRRMEQELREAKRALEVANSELNRSNTALQQFAYAASHDLQEPLRSVRSSVQLLQKRYAESLDARAQEYIAHAVSGATRMERLIQDLLTFSRVSAGPQDHAPLPLGEALAAARANLATALHESEAMLTCDPLPTVQADHSQMSQLFQNLVGNALKFRGAQPARVHVSAQRGLAQGAAVAGQAIPGWVISVQDQGIGIAPEHFGRIFELFKRLHSRDEYAGTGIGLALCQKVVERHGGRIWVESAPGQGTTFYFSLPDRVV